jgi:2-dehydro-3-deoxygluconokinase
MVEGVTTAATSKSNLGRIVCLGEIMLRLTAPDHAPLLRHDTLRAHFGGAEANVAVALSSLGHDTAFVTRVPRHRLGDAVVEHLRLHGVDTQFVLRGGDRLGIYYLMPGAVLRPSEIIYDRAASSFATAGTDLFDWAIILEGADRLHLSGITPALGVGAAEIAIDAARAASSMGVPVSFDGNYRAALWSAWEGRPREVLTKLVEHADIVFGNVRDLRLLLDQPFTDTSERGLRMAAEAAFGTFPKLRILASTERGVETAESNSLRGRIDAPGSVFQTDMVTISGIVDRIGTGDAFAAGVLHALQNGEGEGDAVEAGLALAILKHGRPGDVVSCSRRELAAFRVEGRDVIR